jgi:hypothetical protein
LNPTFIATRADALVGATNEITPAINANNATFFIDLLVTLDDFVLYGLCHPALLHLLNSANRAIAKIKRAGKDAALARIKP